MPGIWHRGEWLKRHLAQPVYCRVQCGSPISGLFIAFVNEKFIPLIFMCKCTNIYVDFVADMLMIFLSLLCWLYICFITTTTYDSRHVFTCE